MPRGLEHGAVARRDVPGGHGAVRALLATRAYYCGPAWHGGSLLVHPLLPRAGGGRSGAGAGPGAYSALHLLHRQCGCTARERNEPARASTGEWPPGYYADAGAAA